MIISRLSGILSRRVINSINCRRTKVTQEDIENEYHQQTLYYPYIGAREILCKTSHARVGYWDDPREPCAEVRYGLDTPEMRELKQKERDSHWSELSLDEKRRLYRHSFRQTISEITAPNYEWIWVSGVTLILISICIIANGIVRKTSMIDYTNAPPRDEEMQKKYLIRTIQQGQNKITGIASHWDYERGTWKWNP
ncbi:hypothetical protein ACOME3_008319 [Neoechinorhynchus agilis]